MTDPQRVALVTGSARRIGAVIARHLHGHGYRLALHAHQSGEELQALAFDLESERPGSVLAVQADLRDAQALPRASDVLKIAVPAFARGEGIAPELVQPAYLRDNVALTLVEQQALRASR